MFKFMRRAIAMALAASLVIATPVYAAQSPTVAPTPVAPSVQDDAKAEEANGVKATVDTEADGSAALVSVEASTAKSVTIPSKLKVNGVEYTVTTLEKGALKNLSKAKTITLPETITTLKKGSIQAKKLKTLKINSKKAPKVEKGAFKGKNTKKMTIKVNKKNMSKSQFKTFKKRLKKAGYKGKVVRK
ncbi:leucine-rich repeat protein [Butyrivibrio sp. VCD2006]|uniref:leucine-rich repeat protein n=1 Tax=Butyrivibrio sp. VCD2006 TaxID=1280664 RepID=UPI00042802D6|nr:leucine-rich repeat protein [Butyrivibrio sp. VCD2006]